MDIPTAVGLALGLMVAPLGSVFLLVTSVAARRMDTRGSRGGNRAAIRDIGPDTGLPCRPVPEQTMRGRGFVES